MASLARMPQPERVFLDWSEPTAKTAARWLKNRKGVLAIVPTQQSGRRLRWAMGKSAPDTICTPAQFLEPAAESTADPLTATLALAEALATTRAARCRALFPAGVPARTFSERLALAGRLRSLRAEVAEYGLSLEEAAARFAFGSLEAARWRDLSQLSGIAGEILLRSGLRDRDTLRLEALRDPQLPAGIAEIAVVAIADLQPVVAAALEQLAIPVAVLIPGPRESEAFDTWGRPLPAAWNDRDPGWNNFDAQVRLAASPENLDPSFDDALEIGLLDRNLLPALEERALENGRVIHDPTGTPLPAHWLVRTLAAFAALVAEPDFDRATDLLRNGAVRAWLASKIENPDLDAALEFADEIRAKHFTATLRAALPWARRSKPLLDALTAIESVVTDLRAKPLEAAQQLAGELSASFPDDTTQCIVDAIENFRTTTGSAAGMSATDWLHTLQESLASVRIYPQRIENAIDANGWLELPWSESKRLLLVGMNIGRVPAPVDSALFLNESSRALLAMPGNEQRQARDAYFLARLLAMPRSVEIVVLKTDADGSPLDPSPLLFAGAGDTLPARVERLFADAPPPEPDPAWSPGWQLDPPVVDMPRVIAVTDFQRYLDCPFTFYLARVAKMKTFEPAVDELDAAQFGDLLHFALEGWARDSTVVNSTDPAAITRTLDHHIDAWVAKNLGHHLSLPLRLQVESAQARLAAFANWQAQDHREGWRVRWIEKPFAEILGRPWELDGWTISGRIDRIDENERDGRWRVIDYKTFDSADGPDRKHLRAFRTADRIWPPDYARVSDGNQWWTNLQLPLYRQLLLESGRDAVLCGYFNLPKTIAETGLQTWDALDDTLQASAMNCARGVMVDLARRKFWPPNPRAAYSEFAEFFPPDATRVVDPNGNFIRSCTA
jgi:ATP-dependent helicase/nuclease subunit B